MTETPDGQTEGEADGEADGEVVDDVQTVYEDPALATLFGSSAKLRLVTALLDAHPEPLNPATLIERADLGSRTSWYQHQDDLLASGLVEQRGARGNSPVYGLARDDPRIEALQILRDHTAAHLRDDAE